MNEKQKAMVLDLIAEWAGILNESSAAATMSEIKKDLNETWFAWSGAVTGEPEPTSRLTIAFRDHTWLLNTHPSAMSPPIMCTPYIAIPRMTTAVRRQNDEKEVSGHNCLLRAHLRENCVCPSN
jgi:hypothetical protein